MHRYWKARHTCPQCKFSWASEIPVTVMKLRKVDFFWINRDQRSFEWFVNLLSQLEIEQAELGSSLERFLEMHMYITSALQKNDMKAVGLQLAMDLLHEKVKNLLYLLLSVCFIRKNILYSLPNFNSTDVFSIPKRLTLLKEVICQKKNLIFNTHNVQNS